MKWNANQIAVRDKMSSEFNYELETTFETIEESKRSSLPDKVMLNTHPQRWSNGYLEWLGEYSTQSLKNILKRQIVQKGKKGAYYVN